MASNLQDEILEFKDYREYNISYPVIITRWEIKQVSGLNKLYLQVYFQKLTNNVKAFRMYINCYSAFGKEIEMQSDISIQDVDKKEVGFSQVLSLNSDTRKVEISICQCLLTDDSIIEKNDRQIVVDTFKPFAKEDKKAGKMLLSNAVGYPIDNITHWYCACGTLNISDSQECIVCDNEKSKVFQCITTENIQKEKENIKQKELKKQQELEEKKKKQQKQLKLSVAIGVLLVVLLILAIILVCTLAPIGSVSYNGMKFEKVGSTYQLVDYIGDDTEVKIPSQIRGVAVTSIGSSAFSSCSKLTSIEIPSSITYIGDYTFRNCYSLASIEIPSSVTSIGSSVFEYCSSLKSIEILSSVTSIGDRAFSGCSRLTSIEIPNSVTSIGSNAFRDCSRLTSIEIPSSVTSIGYRAFYNCYSLTIYCEASSKPSGWHKYWNSNDRPVVWSYKK